MNTILRTCVLACLMVLAAAASGVAQTTSEEAARLAANKQLVVDFFDFEGSREERAERFMTPDYIQHNPRFLKMDQFTGATGNQAWVQAWGEAERRGVRLVELGGIPLRNPPAILTAEGDLVTAIYKGDLPDPTAPGQTYEAFAFETFRVRDGKFVEHWDQVTLEPDWMDPQR